MEICAFVHYNNLYVIIHVLMHLYQTNEGFFFFFPQFCQIGGPMTIHIINEPNLVRCQG
jgi:hypothetical protein